jgi:dynein intermediate chain 1
MTTVLTFSHHFIFWGTSHKHSIIMPVPLLAISGSCSTYEIFDEYIRDFERQKQEEASKQKPGSKKAAAGSASGGGSSSSSSGPGGRDHHREGGTDPLSDQGVDKVLHILDRMVNQNMFADIAMDFKYWDDSSDVLR